MGSHSKSAGGVLVVDLLVYVLLVMIFLLVVEGVRGEWSCRTFWLKEREKVKKKFILLLKSV